MGLTHTAVDEFGAPAIAVRGRNRSGKPYIDTNGIWRDRWDRPLLPDPVTGEDRAWTSVSTLARTLADTYNLSRWQQRQVARGMGVRPDLCALASRADPDDRATLQRIADDAMEAAGSSAGRNIGTALHEATVDFDRADTGARVDIVRRAIPTIATDLKAYAQTIEQHGLKTDPRLMERMTVCRELESAGTFDRFYLCPDGKWRVGDLKTGQHADEWGHLELATQLTPYANGEALWKVLDKTTGEGVWEAWPVAEESIDRTLGILVWLPSGQGRCEISLVDLNAGMRLTRKAVDIRAERKNAKSLVRRAIGLAETANTPAAAPPERDGYGQWIVARYKGKCSDCDEEFSPGAEIRATPSGGWAGRCCELPEQGGRAPGCPECDTDTHQCKGCGEHHPHGVDCPCATSVAPPPASAPPPDPDGSALVAAVADDVDRITTDARQALDELLLKRIRTAESPGQLMFLANQHEDSWTPTMQAAAAARWEELQRS